MPNVYILRSFTKTQQGGNSAGVVLEADDLSDIDMLKISKILGFSETAFVRKSDKADYQVRFFTPSDEVDLCGHATIAAFFLLNLLGIIGTGSFKQETRAGILNIEVKENGIIFMNQNPPKYFDIIPKDEIMYSLNISQDDFIKELPVQIVSTGLKDIIVPVKEIGRLLSIKPNFGRISQISKKYVVIGFHVFTLDTMFGSTAHCRNFAPLYNIPEESATGTSNAALACYLYKYGKIKPEMTKNIVMEQGYYMGNPSEILVDLGIDENEIKQVKVGGTAVLTKENII